MIEVSVPMAIVGFALTFIASAIGTWFSMSIKLASLDSRVTENEKDIAKHDRTLYGENLNNGLRGKSQEHGMRIGVIEKQVFGNK